MDRIGAIDLLFAFGLPLAWGFRELWLLRRDRRKREKQGEDQK